MKHILFLIFVGAFLTGCQASTLKMVKDENTKIYSKTNDPVYGKVHSFQFESECGDLKRSGNGKKNFVGNWHDSDCGQNSVRSEIAEDVWEDNRPGEGQPKIAWYRWNVYLPKDFPIQDTGKLLLGQWHNGECPHVSFTSRNQDRGKLYFETMKTWQGDCKETKRIHFTSIQELRGKWTEFVIYSEWGNQGKFQIYINGEQRLDFEGPTLTKGKEFRNYLKVGIYQCCNARHIPIKPASAMFTTPERSSKSFLPK